MQVREDLDKHLKTGPGEVGMSYSELKQKVTELKQDIEVYQQQRKNMLHVNPINNAYEYVGESIPLDSQSELKTVEAIIAAMKTWLSKYGNDRLSVLPIFEAMDRQSTGEVNEANFKSAMERLGIKLRPDEFRLLRDVLDLKNNGYFKYRSLVRELLGVPQLDFMNRSLIKLAKIVNNRDITDSDFSKLIDPNSIAVMTLDQFKANMAACKANDFNFDEVEVNNLFKSITKAVDRTVGLKMNTADLVELVFAGVKALLIEQVADAMDRNHLTLG